MVEPQEGQCDKSREEFERVARLRKWHNPFATVPFLLVSGQYQDSDLKIAWEAWQASRPALDKAVMWLYGHCRAIGMTEFSDSKLPEDDIALFTIRLKERAEAAAKALGDEVRKKADVQSENEKLRELLHRAPKMIHRHDMLNQPIDCHACKWIKERDKALSPIPAQPETVPTSNCIGEQVTTLKGAPPGVAAPSWAQDIKADIKADTLLGVYSGGDVSSVYVNWFRWQRLADWLNEEWRTKRALPTVCEDCQMPTPHAATSSCIRNMVEAKPSPDSLELEIARHTVRSVDAIYDAQEG